MHEAQQDRQGSKGHAGTPGFKGRKCIEPEASRGVKIEQTRRRRDYSFALDATAAPVERN
jgi:hypothetical protein